LSNSLNSKSTGAAATSPLFFGEIKMETETETLPRPLVLTSYEIDKLRELVDIYYELDMPYEEGLAWDTLRLALKDYDLKCAGK
tara:strand:- start:139 stop:390 length:252 start_codon:yes stop_codon:yes gene_type:complete